MFDSHSHVADAKFDNDRELIFEQARASGIKGWVEIGTSVSESRDAINFSENHPTVWASVGVHPNLVSQLNDVDWEQLNQLTHHHKVVAIGEVGLDYYSGGSMAEQLPALKKFLQLAVNKNLPIIFHVRSGERDAHKDLLSLLEDMNEAERPRGVLHMFGGSPEQASRYVDLGYYISFSGALTFKKAGALPEVAKVVPLEKILAETDCPYVAPEPHRGERNEPAYVEFVVRKLAELRGMSFEEISNITEQNAKALFGVDF